MSSAGDAPPGTSRPPNNANTTSPPQHLAQRRIIEEFYSFEGWRIRVAKSSILPSACYCARGAAVVGKHASSTEATRSAPAAPRVTQTPPGTICQVCTFSGELQLTHLPEMVFPDNVLELVYEESGFVINFNALDAMKLIDTTSSPIHVAYSDEWKALKAESGLPVTEALQAFDWTYSTTYKGIVKAASGATAASEESAVIRVDSSSRLNLQKLKQREPILFSDEITLYEDELHDNGVSILTAKLRVMPSGFFVLLRFFLRVDQVMVRICDTRIHYETGNFHFIRQFQTREQTYQNLAHLDSSILTNPNALYEHLPVIREINETICLSAANPS